MTIQEYFGEWSQVIDLQQANNIIHKLRDLANHNITICPSIRNIFKAFHLCPLHKLQLVIMGQDPYPTLKPANVSCTSVQETTPVATGLAFANSSDTPQSSFSPSLKVLRDSLINADIPHGIITFEPSLEKWEEQGVLLINAALSCQAGKPGSHNLLWKPFMQSLLTRLSTQYPGNVYILFGTAAQALEPYINAKFNHILKERHPSYYARTGERMKPDIWKQANSIIRGQSGQEIKWYDEY